MAYSIRTLYQMTCVLHSSSDVFYSVWDPYLNFVGPVVATSLLLRFPQSA
uniref:Uncharacterized protein n=1 Tax=Anguilla anguilla TaxID=7936 RepID=A0A0E9PBX6_ANGAN